MLKIAPGAVISSSTAVIVPVYAYMDYEISWNIRVEPFLRNRSSARVSAMYE